MPLFFNILDFYYLHKMSSCVKKMFLFRLFCKSCIRKKQYLSLRLSHTALFCDNKGFMKKE